MKKIFFITVVFLFSTTIFSQQKSEYQLFSRSAKEWKPYMENIQNLLNRFKTTREIEAAAQALLIAQQQKDSFGIAHMYYEMGKYHFEQKKYFMAISYYFKTYQIIDKYERPRELAYCFLNIGDTYYEMNVRDFAEDYYRRALVIGQRIENSRIICMSLQRLTKIQLALENYDSALTYVTRSSDYALKDADSLLLAKNQVLLANINLNTGKIQDAELNFSNALRIYKNRKDSMNSERIYLELGDLYFQQNLFDDALENYLKAEGIFPKSVKKVQRIEISLRTARVFKQKVDFEKALTALVYVLECIDNVVVDTIRTDNIEEDLLNYKKEAYGLLSEISESQKKFDLALMYQKKQLSVADSISEKDKSDQFMELQVSLQTQDKDNEIKLLDMDKNKSRNERNALLAIAILILSFALLLFFRYRDKEQTNKLLSLKNEETQQQKEELTATLSQLNESEKKLREANQAKDRMFSIIGHDLRGPIGSFKQMLTFLLEDTNNLSDKEAKDILTVLKNSASTTYNLLENLLLWANSQQNEIIFAPEKFSINTIIDETLELVATDPKRQAITIVKSINKDFSVIADRNMVQTIIRNLLSNALKFTPEMGKVEVLVHKTSHNNIDFVEVTVIDSGVGIKDDNVSKIFNRNLHFSTYGTNREKGSGLGLILCKEFVERHGGTIGVKSQLGQGSRFWFTIPAAT